MGRAMMPPIMKPRIVQTNAAPLRAVRVTLFAAVCVVLAGAGHAVVVGHEVPLGVLLVAGGGVAALAWSGSARRRGPYVLGGALLAAQAGLHLLFARLAPDPVNASAGGHNAAGHPGAGSALQHPAPDVGPDQLAAAEGHGSPAMLAAHLLATLGCALWLWRGETAFFQVLRVLRTRALPALVRLLAPVVLPDATTPPAPVDSTTSRPRTPLLAHSRHGRAPPVTPRDLAHATPD